MAGNPDPILLLTRPLAQSLAYAEDLRAKYGRGLTVLISPLTQIVPLNAPLDLGGITGLIFTSQNGAQAFAARVAARDLPAFCVGERTAECARALGFTAMSADGSVQDLAGLIAAQETVGKLLYTSG